LSAEARINPVKETRDESLKYYLIKWQQSFSFVSDQEMTGVILFIMRIVLFCPNRISGYFWELSNPRAVQWRKEENIVTLRSGVFFVRKNITVKTGFRNFPGC